MDLGNALFQRGGLFGILFHYSLTSVSISANESGISTWVLLRLEYCIEIVNTPAIPASDMSADMVYRTVGAKADRETAFTLRPLNCGGVGEIIFSRGRYVYLILLGYRTENRRHDGDKAREQHIGRNGSDLPLAAVQQRLIAVVSVYGVGLVRT